jgi:ribonuclease G
VPTDILISSDPWENRVAILEDGNLSEIYFEREEKVIGSIYKGKVQNVLPGMGASFVDIGLGRNAFLYVDDINKTPLNIGDVEITQGRSGWTITEKVNRGDDVLVQIVKEPRGLKGARISTNISLPGRYLILMPTGKYSGVSRKIESAEERNRLKKIMQRIRPEGMATVVRTAAGGVSDAELMADLGVLIRMWHGILEQFKRSQAPALLHKDMNLVFKAARDFITPEVEHVYIDDADEAERVRDFMRLLGPQYVERIQPYKGGRNLFKDYKIDDELTKLLRPTVKLPSGGSIVIETTEALTVIDVNSGKFTGGKNLEDTIVRTNVEAAAEIARQVRLRDIGGIIVCDFIDMNTEASRNKVIATLEGVLRKDRTRSTIQSFSGLGLLEFTRKRVGKDLAQQLRGACPTCSGIGSVLSPESVTISTFRKLRDDLAGKNGDAPKHTHLHASPTVAASVEFWYEDELKALEAQLHTQIDVRVDPTVHPEKPRIAYDNDPNGAAMADEAPIRVGDEVVVDVMHARLPIPGNALAVVHGRLVEIENGANLVGQTIKIKIIDVDGKDILAEAGTSFGIAGAEPRQKRRRRGGRGRSKPISIEEQTEELQELADEAARGQNARVAIGISTQADVEAEDELVKTTGTARAAAVTGEIVESDLEPVGEETAEGQRKKRRRRRRRRGGAGDAAGTPQEAVASAAGAAADADDAEGDAEGDDDEDEGTPEGEAVAGQPLAADGTGPRKRRRRRRRRGRGGDRPEGTVQAGQENGAPSVPDRGIFRVGADGSTEHTGETAPKEPSRALDHRGRNRSGPPAVEPPPPSLTAPDEQARPTRPSRRRRNGSAPMPPGTLHAPEPLTALPSPAESEAEPVDEADSDAPLAPPPVRGRRRRAIAEAAEAAAAAAQAAAPAEVVAAVIAEPEPEAATPAKPARRGRGKVAEAAPEPVAAAPEPEAEPDLAPEPEAPAPRGRVRTTRAKAAPAPTPEPELPLAPEPEPEPVAAPARTARKKAPAPAAAPARKATAKAAPAAKAPAAAKKAAPAKAPARKKATPAAAPPAKKSSAPAKKTAAKKTATAAKKSPSRKK